MQGPPHRQSSKSLSSSGKGRAGALTRETLAGDIAAFKKAGGHIEVLGHTPFRTAAASRSTGKPTPPVTGTGTAAAGKTSG